MDNMYVTRDMAGLLYLWFYKPVKAEDKWDYDYEDRISLYHNSMLITSKLFSTIKWEDAEPAKISLAITKTDDKDEFYVVKNADNSLYLWHYKPVKRGEEWCFGNHDKLTFLYYGNIPIPEHLFPEVRWEDEHPTKVKLTLL